MMILVDMYIPAIDDSYDFLLDENVPVEQIMLEVSEMMVKKVKGVRIEYGEEFMLCSAEQKKVLGIEKTLYENGITDGSRLIFV